MRMAPESLAQQERETLCDLFAEFGPDAPTLCAGWVTADLAAHLVARERRPDSGPGLVWPPLAGHTERVRRSLKDRTPWETLIATVRGGPPLLLRPFDGPMNTIEFFIHVEDVRRAQSGWAQRPISPELADALWARVGPGGMAKKVPATIVISSPGRPEKQSGAGPRISLTGDPGELTLFGAGRQAAALVDVAGDPELAVQLRAASLGV
ncbi:MAG: TIGR03085 family metal-binding protein [Acidimicrobiales bacterium]